MFMLRNVGKYIFGDSTKQDIIQLDQGQLYIVRPHSVKGYSECMYDLLLHESFRKDHSR